MAGHKKYPCEDYRFFKSCAHGSEKCGQSREILWESDYFLAEITKISDKFITVKKFQKSSTSDKTFFVRGSKWHRHYDIEEQAELKGQLVVFQASKAKCDSKCGRIVLLLGEAQHFSRRPCDVVVSAEVEAFTLYPKKSTMCRNAISITKCSEHHGDECKKIGIHIPAMAWCLNKSIASVPSFHLFKESKLANQDGNSRLSKFLSFKLKNRSLAISAYIHSSDTKQVEGPIFTPVYITQHYTPDNYREIQCHIDLMCIMFKEKKLQKILKDKHYWHFTVENELRKLRFVVDEALNLHTQLVTEYFRLSAGQYTLATVVPKRPSKSVTEKLINNEIDGTNANMEFFVLRDHMDAALKSDSNGAAKWLASSLQIMTFRETSEENTKMAKNLTEVVKESEIGNDQLVCVFGHKGARFLVNQQILIQSMLSLPPLYEKGDLLGVIVRRYPQPQLVKSLIRRDDPDFLHLNYIDLLGIDLTLRKLRYSEMGAFVESKGQDKVELTWKNFHCEKIKYDKVLRVDAAEIGRCFSDLQSSADAKIPLSQMENVEMAAPFSKTSAGKLKFTPVPGMVIQMQICSTAPYHPSQVGFRMLRVGKNGHVCLAHMNSPKLMFASDNKLLQSLPLIKNLSDTSNIKKIHPTESGCVIRWNGRYNGGGWFKTELSLQKGQLLCIRKDIKEDNELKYVWNAHGIVAEEQADDGEVSFSVCTLSQPGETTESHDFVIEYIDEVCE